MGASPWNHINRQSSVHCWRATYLFDFIMVTLDATAGNVELDGAEIHGFWTLKDLNLQLIYKEARERWLRPNEIHAMLCNSDHVGVQPRPRNLPESGTVVLFNRRVLENFRNDGHKWRTKRYGRGVMESHHRLKLGVGGAGIFVCYAYGADKSSFVRRCYWLDDEARANIVLVHYRETKKLQGSPVPPVNPHSGSTAGHPYSAAGEEPQEIGTTLFINKATGPSEILVDKDYERRFLEINTLEWNELLGTNNSNNASADNVSYFEQQNQIAVTGAVSMGASPLAYSLSAEASSDLINPVTRIDDTNFNMPHDAYGQTMGSEVNLSVQRNDPSVVWAGEISNIFPSDGWQSQDSFEWMNSM